MFVGFLRKGVHLERPLVKILTHGDSYDTGLHLRKELCADCRAEVSVEIALGLKVALGESRVLCGSCVQTFMKNWVAKPLGGLSKSGYLGRHLSFPAHTFFDDFVCYSDDRMN